MENIRNRKAEAVRGAIYGDIIGSVYEFNPICTKDFELFTDKNFFTDDTVITLAIAKAVMDCKENYSDMSEAAVYWMQKLGRKYPNAGYGARFEQWIQSNNPKPYNSYGNGAAMRISPVGTIARNIEEAKELSRKVTEVTHNHPEGIKGAEVTAVSIFLALNEYDKAKKRIQKFTEEQYGKLKSISYLSEQSEQYKYSESCQKSVPESVECFLEATDFEDTIRNCVLLGGDCDTMGAIAGAISAAYYGAELKGIEPLDCLTTELRDIFEEWKDFVNDR